ncbi:MAG TPA: protein kinase family protein [Nocardioidaceae bacterium]|nr:protein kinase family protein [Nocardioidaceae bacterium]
MAEKPIGPGTVLAGRFRLEDLLQENGGARFWRACDLTLARNVAVHVVGADDERADTLLAAARASATVTDGHILRVLDAAEEHGVAYVVNEWGSGVSLDRMLNEGPLSPRRAAWVVKEVADALDTAHRNGVAHGRLIPENVMVSEAGAVKLIGFVVDGVLNGARSRDGATGFGDQASDVTNLAALLYAGLVARWPGTEPSVVPPAPTEHGHPLRPRQVRAGIPRPLDAICDRVLNPNQPHRHMVPVETAQEVAAALSDFIGDPTGTGPLDHEHTMVLGDGLRLGAGAGAATDTSTDTSTDSAAEQPPEQPTEQPTETTAEFAGEATGDTAAQPDQQAAQEPADPAVPEPAAPAPAAPAPAAPEDEPAPAPAAPQDESDPEPAASEDEPEAQPAPERSTDPEPTQAGAPVFYDEGSGVGWISPGDSRGLREEEPRRTPPPPPPPLPEPEPKPLFAPDPPGGRPRRGWPEPASSGFAPTPGPHTGSLPPVWGPDADQPPPDEDEGWEEHQRAGRGWLRLASVVAGVLLLIVAVIVAFNFGRGSGGAASPVHRSSPSQTKASTPTGQVLPVVGVRDFDPEADPPEENPQMAPLAVDGDPGTAWQTMTYYGNPQLGGLKDGVGLVLDLGKQQSVSDVALQLVGSPTSLEVFADGSSGTAPTSISGLAKVASVTGAGTHLDLQLKHPVTTQYLVIWLTSLPPASGGYKGQIAEITVRS